MTKEEIEEELSKGSLTVQGAIYELLKIIYDLLDNKKNNIKKIKE
jgi:hypothetical protein